MGYGGREKTCENSLILAFVRFGRWAMLPMCECRQFQFPIPNAVAGNGNAASPGWGWFRGRLIVKLTRHESGQDGVLENE